MIVLNTIKKHYNRLDVDVKSGKSTSSRKTTNSQQVEPQHKILAPHII